MESEFALMVLGYLVFCFFVVFPPTEAISAGLTIEKLFGRFLGDEQMGFVQFHLRRASLTLFVHSCLPFLFFVLVEWREPGFNLVTDFAGLPWPWQLGLVLAIFLPVTVGSLLFYWTSGDWSAHPTVKTLKLYNENWRGVARTIDDEYRRVDKFSVGLGGIRRVVVTDSWILLISSYRLQLSQQPDVNLTVVSTDDHAISHHSDAGTQFLNIRVETYAKPISPFTLRLNSLNYGDLRQKLTRPVETARDVIIHQTLDEQFVAAFVEQSNENPAAQMTDAEKETRSNVKLEKNCLDYPPQQGPDGENLPSCRQCYCRPMWCVACMGRWFASRQDPRRPEGWLGGKSPCPTCRATFCVLDVSVVPP